SLAQVRSLATSVTTTPGTSGAAAVGAKAVEAAIAALNATARERPLHVHISAAWTPTGGAACWVVVEPGPGAGRDDWTAGGQADVLIVDPIGATVATGRGQMLPTAPAVRIGLTLRDPAPGDYEVRIR